MGPDEIKARLRRERLTRGWDVPDMARALRQAGHTSEHDALLRQIRRWERTGSIGERNRILYARAFRTDVDDLFGPPPGAVLDAEERERVQLAVARPARIDTGVIDALAKVLAVQRRTEDVVGSTLMLAPVDGQLHTIEHLAREARGPVRARLIDVAAQWAQFAGWLHIAVGDLSGARVWLDRTEEWALEVGDATMLANALSFKGELSYQRGDTGPMISLARAAQRDPATHTSQRAFDAQFEARGHAMDGDLDAARRALDVAAARTDEIGDDLPPWMYYQTAEFIAMDRGLVYRYLGAHDPRFNGEAIRIFAEGIAALGDDRRSEWGSDYVLQLAYAYAQADAPDDSARAAREVAETARATASRRLADAVTGLHDDLAARWPNEPAVAELADALR